MSIHKRMLALALGIALPLALVGLASLWGMWTLSRHQLDGALKQQAELAAVALERWVDVQRQPLTTIAAYIEERPAPPASFHENLRYIATTRPHWIDLRIVNAAGATIIAQPQAVKAPRASLVKQVFTEMQRRQSWAVVTDWEESQGMPVLALGAPIKGGGAVIARVAGAAMEGLFANNIPLNGAGIVLLDPQRRILYRSPATSSDRGDRGTEVSDAPLRDWLNGRGSAVIEVDQLSAADRVQWIYGLARAGATDCTVMIGVPSVVLYQPARQQLTSHLLLSLLAILCAVGATLIISRGLTAPIRRLREAAHRLGTGDLNARAPVAGGGEIKDLGVAFNAMANQIKEREARLAELDRLKSEFVSSVSHELRTPLTTIKTLTHVLLRDEVSAAERQEYLETIAAECNRQIDLVLNLLDLSRIEAGAFSVNPTRVEACEMIRACLKLEKHAAETRGQELRAELPPEELFLCADRSALRRVLCGLIQNALKYTPAGGKITLSAQAVGREVALGVADTGRGITAADLPHIFEKFYRGRSVASATEGDPHNDAAELAGEPGVGLGLYLARVMIEQMGGRLTVTSEPGKGSIFTISLPAWHVECVANPAEGEGMHAEPASGRG